MWSKNEFRVTILDSTASYYPLKRATRALFQRKAQGPFQGGYDRNLVFRVNEEFGVNRNLEYIGIWSRKGPHRKWRRAR